MKQIRCCPDFNLRLWDKKTHFGKDFSFFRENGDEIMFVPTNLSFAVHKIFKKIEAVSPRISPKRFLLFSSVSSPWKSDFYKNIKNLLAEEKMVKNSGVFVSRVFDGPYNYVSVWMKEMDEYLASRRQKSSHYYFHFSYCPSCAKKHRHNYCVALAQVN